MAAKETFEEFKDSFFYGCRSDMSFKFLEHLSEQDASKFLQDFFRIVVDGIDANEPQLIENKLIEGQIQGYAEQKHFTYDQGPFTPVTKKVSEMKLALLTSSGHFVNGFDPEPFGIKNLSQTDAEMRIMDFLKEEPILSEIPFDTKDQDLCVRHGGYDVRAALKDANVNFPLGLLRKMDERGEVGSLTKNAYSFVGACSQKRLLGSALPNWVENLQQNGAEAALLIPV